MDLVPRFVGIALIGLALAGTGEPAFAGDTAPANTTIASLPPTGQDFSLPADARSGFAAPSQSDRRDGYLDFFSVQPEIKSGDFTSLLGNSTSGGGLKFHWNW